MTNENTKKNEQKNTLPKELKNQAVKELSKKYELDNVNDLWYFVKSGNRWVMGSAQ